jgi:hypothetical protein
MLFLNSLLFLGLLCSIMPIYSIPVEVIPSQGIVYPIHVACECDYKLYVDGKLVNPAGIVTNWDGTGDGVNVTNIFNPVLFEPKPKIIAFNNIDNKYPGFMNGFVMDMNNGQDYTKHTDWKCKYFDSIVPSNWMNYDYDDSGWEMAISYGMNYQNNSYQIFEHERDGIHLNAEWLWTSVNSNPNIYCRKKSVDNEPYYVETKPATTSAPSHMSHTHEPVVSHSPTHIDTDKPIVSSTPKIFETHIPVVSDTSTSTPVATQQPVVLPTPTPVATHQPVVLPTPTPVATHQPVILPTPTPVATHQPVVLPTPTPVATHQPVILPTLTPVATHQPVVSPTPTPVAPHKIVVSPTPTSVETHKPVFSPTPTPVAPHKIVVSPTPTSVETHKPVFSPTPTHQPIVLPTPTPVATHQPVISPTPTHVETHQPVFSPTPTPVVTHKPIVSPTPTHVATHQPVVLPTLTSVATPTFSKSKNNIIINQHITYIIQKFKYTQKSSYSHIENLIRNIKYINQNHDLYKNLIYTRNHLHHHYNTIFKELYRLLNKYDTNNKVNFPDNNDNDDDDDAYDDDAYDDDAYDDDDDQYKIPPFIESMKKLDKYIQKIEKSIQFIKGKYKNIFINILYKLKLQYREDTIKLLKYWEDGFN